MVLEPVSLTGMTWSSLVKWFLLELTGGFTSIVSLVFNGISWSIWFNGFNWNLSNRYTSVTKGFKLVSIVPVQTH